MLMTPTGVFSQRPSPLQQHSYDLLRLPHGHSLLKKTLVHGIGLDFMLDPDHLGRQSDSIVSLAAGPRQDPRNSVGKRLAYQGSSPRTDGSPPPRDRHRKRPVTRSRAASAAIIPLFPPARRGRMML